MNDNNTKVFNHTASIENLWLLKVQGRVKPQQVSTQ